MNIRRPHAGQENHRRKPPRPPRLKQKAIPLTAGLDKVAETIIISHSSTRVLRVGLGRRPMRMSYFLARSICALFDGFEVAIIGRFWVATEAELEALPFPAGNSFLPN